MSSVLTGELVGSSRAPPKDRERLERAAALERGRLDLEPRIIFCVLEGAVSLLSRDGPAEM